MKKFLIRWKQKDKYHEFIRETKVTAINENTAKMVFYNNFHDHKKIEIIEIVDITDENNENE